MLRRALHLLRHHPALFAEKLGRRFREARARRKQIRAALTDWYARSVAVDPPATPEALLSAIGREVPVVVLERRANYVCCGIRSEDTARAVVAALVNLPELGLRENDSFVAMDISALLRRCSGSTAFTLGMVDAEGPHFWRFEIFERNESGTFVSRRASNKIAGILYADHFQDRGLVALEQLMPEFSRSVTAPTVDLVYTWVNHADEGWKKAYATALGTDASADAVSESRFHSNDELRYSLRSVHRNLPWMNAIHIVSNCEPPDWLEISHPRIRWVSHEAILPSNCLPTFNSHAIETSLHRVPDLAENFLYLNDDFLVLDAFPPSTFVNDNGTLNANLERQGVVSGPVSADSPDYLNAARNSARLLFERFGYYPTRLHRHTPYSLSKSLLYELEEEFRDEFARTRQATFRSLNDLNVTSFLAHHYGFMKRDVVYQGYSSTLVKSNDPFSLQALDDFMQRRRRTRVICLNEGGEPAPTPTWRRKVAAFMAHTFPLPAPWEKH